MTNDTAPQSKPRPAIARHRAALGGTARVPGDKSISHRALMLGALAVGTTRAEGLLEGEDVLATAAALRRMGVGITRTTDDDGNGVWQIDGVGVGGRDHVAACGRQPIVGPAGRIFGLVFLPEYGCRGNHPSGDQPKQERAAETHHLDKLPRNRRRTQLCGSSHLRQPNCVLMSRGSVCVPRADILAFERCAIRA